MRTELAEQHAMLKNELANLDALLASDANWKALSILEAQKGALTKDASPKQYEKKRQELRAVLADNRIFNARERIVEAMALIRQELERDPVSVANVTNPPHAADHKKEAAAAATPVEQVDVSQQVIESPLKPALPPKPDEIGKSTQQPDRETLDAHSSKSVESRKILKDGISHPNMMSQVAARMTRGKVQPSQTQVLSGKKKLEVGAPNVANTTSKATIRTMPPEANGSLTGSGRHVDTVDDFTKIRGINSETANRLNALGIRSFHQVAAWTAKDVSTVRAALGMSVAIAKQNWIEQAAALAVQDSSIATETISSPVEPETKTTTSETHQSHAQLAKKTERAPVEVTEPATADPNYQVPSPVAIAAATILANFNAKGTQAVSSQSNETHAESLHAREEQLLEQTSRPAEAPNPVATVAATILAKLEGDNTISTTSPARSESDGSVQAQEQTETLSPERKTVHAHGQASVPSHTADNNNQPSITPLETEHSDDSPARTHRTPENDNQELDQVDETQAVGAEHKNETSKTQPPPLPGDGETAPNPDVVSKVLSQNDNDDATDNKSDTQSEDGDEVTDAEVEIVQTGSSPAEDATTPDDMSVQPTSPSRSSKHETTGDEQSTQSDDAFDADHYEGYNGHITEASVSIIAKSPAANEPPTGPGPSHTGSAPSHFENGGATSSGLQHLEGDPEASYEISNKFHAQRSYEQEAVSGGKTLKLIKSLMKK